MIDAPRLALRVSPPAERALKTRHPWLFESSITSVRGHASPADPAIQAGTVAIVFDRKNRFLGAGIWDPDGPIRVRMLAFGNPEPVGPALFRARIDAALDRRRALFADPETTGIRLLHGEGDGVSGIVADLYGEHVVAKVYSRSWIPWLDEFFDALQSALQDRGVQVQSLLIRAGRKVADAPGAPKWLRAPHLHAGTLPEGGALPFLEGGLHYEAHPEVGHKTGFYLDQRENRARVRALARSHVQVHPDAPLRVLNVFSYTGGFSLAAAAGGAARVWSLDLSAQALAQAERHFLLNQANPDIAHAEHRTVVDDAFSGMDSLARAGERFGMVIVDPPSFAKEGSQADRALEQYARLTGLAVRLLSRKGTLIQASCSSRVGEEDFFERVHRAARDAGRPLNEFARTGHPVDHPAPFAEGAYLKAIYATADDSGGRGRP